MRRPRRQRPSQAAASGEPATEETPGGRPVQHAHHDADLPLSPFGGWSQAELRSLPRFPHRDSFPMARSLINNFLFEERGLPFRDLQIALFWLGFGLLDMPTVDEPTLGLVPLCKDLDTYADIALELGYDPATSVHSRPAVNRSLMQAHAERAFEHFSARQQQQWRKAKGKGRQPPRGPAAVAPAAPRAVAATSSTAAAGSSGSSSSAGTGAAAAAAAVGGAASVVSSRDGVTPWWQEEVLKEAAAWASSDSDGEAPANSEARYPWTRGAASSCGAASSDHRSMVLGRFGLTGVAEVLPYKVKLLHAGGWSSSSGSGSSSPGQHTPPTPSRGIGGIADSSASAPRGQAPPAGPDRDAGGLDIGHLEQFTVSFVSDLQLHEDLEETSLLCTVCLDEMQIGEELCRLPCMHTFHRCCVHAWLARDRRCMLCRLDVTRPGVQPRRDA